jgi:vitellogenic carboxypeptidase-like protein
MKSTASIFPILLDSGIKVLLYAGQFDLRDGLAGQEFWIKSMDWSGSQEFLEQNRSVWMVKDTVAGYITKSGSLTWIEVTNAGHLVPFDQRLHAKIMIENFIADSNSS